MGTNEPKQGYFKTWGASMTIAAIILGFYLISLFYVGVTRAFQD